MKVKAVILVFLILFSTVLQIQAATDEGYGEDETSLGQFVDSFEDLENISVRVNVERNSTLKAMELNLTGPFQNYENISTFNEVDVGGNHIILNDSTVEWRNQIRNEDSRAWRDYGANFFDDFYFEFKIGMTNVEAGDATNNAMMLPIAIHNSAGDFNNIFAGTAIMIYASQQGSLDDKYNYWLIARKGGGSILDASAFLPLGEYYVIMNRTGIDVDALFFTDSTRTALSFKLSITAWTDNLRYMSLAVSRNAASDPNDHSSGFIQNMTFDPPNGYSETGYFTTVDYLSDPLANGSALVLLTNTTIPGGTEILVEFSEDNSTWVFNDWDPLFGGFEAVDLRDLNYSTGFYFRYNLSTTDSAVTPRIYQSRLITTIGEVGAGAPGQNVTGEWVEYNLTSIIVNVGTHDSGNLASTFFVDGDTYDVSETVGTPAWTVSFNWTGIPDSASCIWIEIYYQYDGNLRHDVDVEIWNFTSSSWVFLGHIVDGIDFVWLNASIYDLRIPNDFVNSSGAVLGRINHPDPGNINHNIFIDYLKLIAFVPSAAPVTAEVFQFFWIALAIALTMIILIIAKMWFEEGDP